MATTRTTSPPPRPPQASSAHAASFTPISLPSVAFALAGHKPTSPATSPKTLGYPRSTAATSPRALTGATALADARRARQQEEERSAPQVTPNPGAVVLRKLMNAPVTTPASSATTVMSDGVRKAGEKLSTPTSNGQMKTTTLASHPANANTTTAMTATALPAEATAQFTAEPESMEDGDDDGMDDDQMRPSTYPGPRTLRDNESTPRRDMSMLGGSYDSGQKSGKRHKCPYCSTDFTRHHNLKSHLLTHSQEKPYVCSTCSARFRRLHDLKRHTKLHTGERNHICPKCGRKFARGDALARHNKGPGGCANRKSSFGADEGDDLDETMDGIEYDNDQDDDQASVLDDHERRVSEPFRKRPYPDSGNETGPFRHSTTYPPPLSKMPRSEAGITMGPPSALVSPASTRPSPNQAAVPTAEPQQVPHHAPSTSAFTATHITESPRPLSPRSQDPHRLSVGDGSHLRTRSPSLTSAYQGHQFARSAPIPAHMSSSHTPQLPSLPGLSGGQPLVQAQSNNIPSTYASHHHTASGSNPGSHSSHGHSSSGSMREILGNENQDIMSYLRNLEQRFSRMQDEYELRISRLQADVIELKSQLFHTR